MAASVGHHARDRRFVFVAAIKVQGRLLNEKACDVKLRSFSRSAPPHDRYVTKSRWFAGAKSYLSRFRLRFVMVTKFFAGLFVSEI
jgi:hypothetical protein